MVQKNLNQNDFSRRTFLKSGVAISAAVGLSTVGGEKTTKEVVKAFGTKELDEFPVELSPDFKRYDQSNNVLRRFMFDNLASLGLSNTTQLAEMGIVMTEDMMTGAYKNMLGSGPGYSQLDKAFKKAGWSVADSFGKFANDPMYPYEGPVADTKYEFESKEEASRVVKKIAKFLGASLVGITEYDEKWVYSHFAVPEKGRIEADLPFKPKSVIVMAIEMDYYGYKATPTYTSEGATGLGYSKMATTAYSIATFIRQLGYKSFGTGNDTAESVPIAIAAGLGELGRHGLLITQEYGPRVRLCKVYTEMELAYDKPIEFGAMKFCEYCKRCAEACPSESIPFDTERSFNTLTVSNHAGMKKWYVNVETCFDFWRQSDTGCGVCITACPYNKPNFWHHALTSGLTSTPLRPFLKSMDELFGYGQTYDEQRIKDFWERD